MKYEHTQEAYHDALEMERRSVLAEPQHEYDDDCVCVKCGFDGAEWAHWRRSVGYNGMAQPKCQD